MPLALGDGQAPVSLLAPRHTNQLTLAGGAETVDGPPSGHLVVVISVGVVGLHGLALAGGDAGLGGDAELHSLHLGGTAITNRTLIDAVAAGSGTRDLLGLHSHIIDSLSSSTGGGTQSSAGLVPGLHTLALFSAPHETSRRQAALGVGATVGVLAGLGAGLPRRLLDALLLGLAPSQAGADVAAGLVLVGLAGGGRARGLPELLAHLGGLAPGETGTGDAAVGVAGTIAAKQRAVSGNRNHCQKGKHDQGTHNTCWFSTLFFGFFFVKTVNEGVRQGRDHTIFMRFRFSTQTLQVHHSLPSSNILLPFLKVTLLLLDS